MPRMALYWLWASGTLGRSPQAMPEAPQPTPTPTPAPTPKRLSPNLPYVGLGLAGLGLLVAISSLFFRPATPKDMTLPLTLIGVGSFFYIPGAFLVFYSERRQKMKPMMGWLRWVRLGFVVLVMYWVFRISQGI